MSPFMQNTTKNEQTPFSCGERGNNPEGACWLHLAPSGSRHSAGKNFKALF